jgi:hypothetical protein
MVKIQGDFKGVCVCGGAALLHTNVARPLFDTKGKHCGLECCNPNERRLLLVRHPNPTYARPVFTMARKVGLSVVSAELRTLYGNSSRGSRMLLRGRQADGRVGDIGG